MTNSEVGSSARSLALPVWLLAASMLVWTGFQTLQLFKEQSQLKKAKVNQEQPLQNSKKLRASLDRLAADTQNLANQGNPNARLLVTELAKRGITINPNANAGSDAGPPKQ